ncbi:MAG TPA: alpha/beta hydrolase [Bryobacteraceae bacterium]|jgi:acetyl esterase|nr:alpha/beta hydrolase [Bryobacteraceae bacterium]
MSNVRNPATDISNPELIPLIQEMDPRGGLGPYTAEEKRRAYRQAVFRSGAPEPVTEVANRTISGPAGEIPIRIYHPMLGSGRLPIVLFLHGGGFLSGDLDTHDPVCRQLANHVPAIGIAVEYRLAPEHCFPAAPEDCFSVLQWLAANGDSLGGDASRIAVVGDSAGGNLAAVLALMARDRSASPLAAQVLIYPMLDATLGCESLVENAFIPPFTLVDCVSAWQQYLPQGADRSNPYVSPLRSADLGGLPPALVITAEFDILADEGAAYVSRLKEAGVDVEHEHFEQMVHGFFQWGGLAGAARLAMNRVVQYLQRRLARDS